MKYKVTEKGVTNDKFSHKMVDKIKARQQNVTSIFSLGMIRQKCAYNSS